jgi:hypothetical protein
MRVKRIVPAALVTAVVVLLAVAIALSQTPHNAQAAISPVPHITTTAGATVLLPTVGVLPSPYQPFRSGPPPTRPAQLPALIGAGPAITPTINPNDPTLPAFTVQEATDYAAMHPPNQALGRPATVTRVYFMTAGEMQAKRLSEIPGPSNRLICVVEFSGQFTVSGPGYSRIGTMARDFYDARTGNYLGVNIP